MAMFFYFILYLGIETVFCRLLLRMAFDGHGLKLQKVGPSFSNFNALPAKITRKIIMVLVRVP